MQPHVRSILRVVLCAALLITQAFAQESSSDTVRAWSIDQRFQGSSSSFGQITKLTSSVNFNFNRRLTLEGGVPYYFVNYAAQDAAESAAFRTGLGNVYSSLHLNVGSRDSALQYVSSVTVTAPTGDRDNGLSTGRVTVDWNNNFHRVFGYRVAPFANVGIANTVSDTPFFLRPFSTDGIVGHFEAGSTLSLSRWLAAGASGYSIVPSGEQTIVSKIVEVHTEPGSPVTVPPNSRGRGVGLSKKTTPDRVFETTREVVGTADLASDHGFSAWFSFGPIRKLDWTIGYSRSARYAMDTLYWGIGMRVGPFGSNVR